MLKNKKIVTCDWTSGEALAADRDAIYNKCGINNISISWGVGFYKNENRFENFETAKRHGLNIDVVHLDYKKSNALWLLGDEGENFCNQTINYLKECGERGIKIAVIHLSESANPPLPSEIGIGRILRILDVCKENGIILAAENVEDNNNLNYALKKIKSKNLGVCFDIGHANCFSKDVFGLFKKYKSRTVCFHLHDNWGEKDDHLTIGSGKINFERFFKIKNKATFYLLEARPKEVNLKVQNYEEFVRKNLDSIKRFF